MYYYKIVFIIIAHFCLINNLINCSLISIFNIKRYDLNSFHLSFENRKNLSIKFDYTINPFTNLNCIQKMNFVSIKPGKIKEIWTPYQKIFNVYSFKADYNVTKLPMNEYTFRQKIFELNKNFKKNIKIFDFKAINNMIFRVKFLSIQLIVYNSLIEFNDTLNDKIKFSIIEDCHN